MPAFITQDRVSRAQEHYQCCRLCEHDCASNRAAGELGCCKAGADARVYRHRIEVGEELELIPSHLFYLSGCDLRCAFCIAEERAFNPAIGEPLTADYLRDKIVWGRQRGARNLQWVGGEPTIHIPAILSAMSGCDDLPPIVWKSDFHGTPAAFDLLAGVVDVYVADFKFGNDDCAKRIASIDNYIAIVGRNLLLAASQADLIVRHLLLPGHFECCFRPVVLWMKEHLPNAKFSIRDGYLPRWLAQHHNDLKGYLGVHAGQEARELAIAEALNVIQ